MNDQHKHDPFEDVLHDALTAGSNPEAEARLHRVCADFQNQLKQSARPSPFRIWFTRLTSSGRATFPQIENGLLDLPAVNRQYVKIISGLFRRFATVLLLVMIVTISGVGIYKLATAPKPELSQSERLNFAYSHKPADIGVILNCNQNVVNAREKRGGVDQGTSSTAYNRLGLQDDLMKKFFMTGAAFRGITTGLMAYQLDHANQAPETIEQMMKPVDYIGTAKDPFGIGDLKYVRQNDEVLIYSVGPDGKWDGGKPIDLADPKLGGDVGIACNIRTGKTRNLFDERLAPYLKGDRLAHELGARQIISLKGPPVQLVPTSGTLAWGKEVDGLRAAMDLAPSKNEYEKGEQIKVRLYVQNVSRHVVQLASSRDRIEDTLILRDEKGVQVRLVSDSRYALFWRQLVRHTLKPGETASFDGLGLSIGTVRLGGIDINPNNGSYKISFELKFPDLIPCLPEDWQGKLTTGEVELRVAR